MIYRRARLIIISILALVAILITGCSKDIIYSSELLSNVTLSSQVDKQLQPIQTSTVFPNNVEKIYCSFTPLKAPIGAMITARWVYVSNDNVDDALVIDQYTQTKMNEDRMAMFLLRPTDGWQKGNYWVALFVDKIAEVQIPFSIK